MSDWLDHNVWFFLRGTGEVLLVLLTISIVLGVMSTARIRTQRWPRFATQALHRNVALLTLVLLFIHISGAVMDTYIKVHWYEAFLPLPRSGEGQWNATAFGLTTAAWLWLGTFASDLMVMIIATSLVRHQMSHTLWRGLHYLSYLSWVMAVLHAVGIGTDKDQIWAKIVAVLCVGVVAAVTVVRFATAGQERELAA